MSPLGFIVLFSLIPFSTGIYGGYRGGGRGRSGGGGSHGYPSSTGYSGTGSGSSYSYTNTVGRTNNVAHSYPSSSGYSGNTQHSQRTNYVHKTEVHNNYYYSPPQHISYSSYNHPVYQGRPPVYVYEYRDSGSRFDTLLTGLALYNLGRMSASNDHYHNSYRDRSYNSQPGEICKLGISKDNGEYEETVIDCKLISSFIWEADTNANSVSTNTVTKTVINESRTNTNGITTSVSSSVTVVDALQAKGPSIRVTPSMTCFMIRSYKSSYLKKKVECGLLQAYARNSLHYTNDCGLISVNVAFPFLYVMFYKLFF